MQSPENKIPSDAGSTPNTTSPPPDSVPAPADPQDHHESPPVSKANNKQKVKRLLIFLGVALVVLFLLNLIPFEALTEKALENLPENTEPVVTYSEDFFTPPDYDENVLEDEIYLKLNRNMDFTREGETFRITEVNANTHGAVSRLFYDYFETLKAGNSEECNKLFTDEYLEKEGRFSFAPQKVYDMTVTVKRSEFLTNGDANGNYKGYTVTYCEVAYKIRQNNGTLRRDFYQEDVTLPVIFEVLEKDDIAKINQISSIRTDIPDNTTQGGSVLMYVIWIAIIALSIGIEAGTATLTAIWFMPAALVSLILALCNVSWQIQVLTFAILSLIFVLIGTTVIRKRFSKKKHIPTNSDRLLDTAGLVTETINNSIPTGEVKSDGKRWSARSEDGSIIEEGEMVTILRIEGVKLIVKKKN